MDIFVIKSFTLARFLRRTRLLVRLFIRRLWMFLGTNNEIIHNWRRRRHYIRIGTIEDSKS